MVGTTDERMNQMEELKVFFSERPHTAAPEIPGLIEKTIRDYKDQASCWLVGAGDTDLKLCHDILQIFWDKDITVVTT